MEVLTLMDCPVTVDPLQCPIRAPQEEFMLCQDLVFGVFARLQLPIPSPFQRGLVHQIRVVELANVCLLYLSTVSHVDNVSKIEILGSKGQHESFQPFIGKLLGLRIIND